MHTDLQNTTKSREPLETAPHESDSPSPTEAMKAWPMRRLLMTAPTPTRGALVILAALLALLLTLGTVLLIATRSSLFYIPSGPESNQSDMGGVAAEEGDRPFADGKSGNALLPWADGIVVIPAGKLNAKHAALADLTSGEIIASRKADELIYPASMTKVMTLIIIAENLPDKDCLKDTVTVSSEVYEAMRLAGASGVGFDAGETVSVESLIYALMLKSDGIAACELARYIAGSEEDFVELMNLKAEKMGLSNTHFMNPTGLFHKNHYSTARDIASIMAYAMNMEYCRRVLKTQSYNAPCVGADGQKFTYTLYHNLIVTHFENHTPNQPQNVTVVAGKTGFTNESRYCLVTYAESASGRGYVCVTAMGDSYGDCINDYLTIYDSFAKP